MGRNFRLIHACKLTDLISGSKKVDAKSTSCNSLKRQGIYTSGLYNLKDEGDQFPRVGICSMDSQPGYTASMETNVGYIGVTSVEGGIYFSAYRNSGGPYNPEVITFNNLVSNNGGGMNIDSGLFTAPTSGYYNFYFNALTHYDLNTYTHVCAVFNGNCMLKFTNGHDSDDRSYSNFNFIFQHHMNKDDNLQLKILNGGFQINSSERLIFTGHLVSETFD